MFDRVMVFLPIQLCLWMAGNFTLLILDPPFSFVTPETELLLLAIFMLPERFLLITCLIVQLM